VTSWIRPSWRIFIEPDPTDLHPGHEEDRVELQESLLGGGIL
jgi:hypothetical protein